MQSEARKRFLEVSMKYPTRSAENFEAIITLAKRIYDAENVGFKIDPDSVEKAVKKVLGVD